MIKKAICSIVFILYMLVYAQAQIITTIAGSGAYGEPTCGFTGDGFAATNATLCKPVGITIDTFGNLYIGEDGNLRIRKVSPTGIISTYAGNGTQGYFGDGGPATAAEFYHIYYIMCDKKGNVYVPDNSYDLPGPGNPRIRKISTTGFISTIAGDSVSGNTGDGGPAILAELMSPLGIAFDKKDNMYIADYASVIRKINKLGIISTICGLGYTGAWGFGGDGGPATAALLNWIPDVAADNKGNIYISDAGNCKIRKIDTNGIISTYAGADTLGGFSGDGGPATAALLKSPAGIICDAAGNVYFSDCANFVVRKISTTGIITTIAGNHGEGFCGDGGPATDACLDRPAGLAFDKQGNLYIADWWNNRVRKVSNVGVMVDEVPSVVGGGEVLNIYPNPTTGNITIEGASGCSIVIYDMVGRQVYTTLLTNNKQILHLSNMQKGIYIVEVEYEDGERVRRRVVVD